jgi:UDP-N-acetylmuramate dehydrogenase
MSGIDWFRQNSDKFRGQCSFDELLSKHTYYRIGGKAWMTALPSSISDLHWLAEGIKKTGVPFFILGQGSNVLISDSGFPGLVIKLSRLNLGIEFLEPQPEVAKIETTQCRIRTGSSVAISTLLRRAAHEGWKGLEFLAGIPGSVGGAITMNAGTHLGETVSRVRRVETYSLLSSGEGPEIFEGAQLQFKYRSNLFLKKGSIIDRVEWEVEKVDPAEVKSLIDQTMVRRKASQPVDYPSCGSVFKNPKSFGMSAWQVIDKLGLRGFQLGQAQFSEKHSNFIINLGNATACDVRALIELAKKRAFQELGISLEEEVIYVGNFIIPE